MLIDLGYLHKKYNLNIKGIIHIGAHHLEEKSIYNRLGIHDIIWIEGNESIANRYKNSGNIVYCAMVSDTDNQEVQFIVTNNGMSSSFLELKTHKQEHPDVYEVQRYTVKTIKLDTLLSQNNVVLSNYNFLNIDIQGAELLALKGGIQTIKNVDYIYLEVNEKELYQGCALLPQIDDFLNNEGFTRVEINMTRHGWGDAFYIRK